MKEEDTTELKVLKDYALVRGELYCRMPEGVLSRCVGQEEAQRASGRCIAHPPIYSLLILLMIFIRVVFVTSACPFP